MFKAARLCYHHPQRSDLSCSPGTNDKPKSFIPEPRLKTHQNYHTTPTRRVFWYSESYKARLNGTRDRHATMIQPTTPPTAPFQFFVFCGSATNRLAPSTRGETARNIMVKWTRRVRSVLSSAGDVTGDWFYYFYLVDVQSELKSQLYLTIFFWVCVASSVFSLLNILVVGLGCNKLCRCYRLCGFTAQTWVSFLEMMLEDVPQLVVSGFISFELGRLSPRAVFNITTSAVNLVLDLLDICEGWEDSTSNEQDNDKGFTDPDDEESLNQMQGAFPIPY